MDVRNEEHWAIDDTVKEMVIELEPNEYWRKS